MKEVTAHQQLEGSQKSATGNCTVCSYRALVVLCVLSILPGICFASPNVPLTVRVFNYAQAPTATLSSAQRDANNILAATGIQVVWLDCLAKSLAADSKVLCEKGWSPELPSVRLLSGRVTKQFQNSEYGFASIPVLVTVSYDHIKQRATRDNSPSEIAVILGCVLAHELGHLLLGSNSHSPAGIMQPQWGRDQIRQALVGGLKFTPEQAGQMRKNILKLEDHRQEASSHQSTVETLKSW